jgi:hypothetical protein
LENHFSQLGWSLKLASIQIFRSKIRPTQEGGGVFYEPLLNKPLKAEEWSAMVMGHIARAWYCGWVPQIGQEIHRESIDSSLVQKLRELQEAADVLYRVCEQAKKIALTLNWKSSALKSTKLMGIHDKQELQHLGKTLLELELLIERLGKAQPVLRAFSQMTKILMHHLKGTEISELGKETADCYRQLNDGIQILKDWIHFTLELAKPVAIQPTTVTTQHP